MKSWWMYALLGAIFGGIMPIFVKRGLKLDGDTTIDSNLATAIRVVMLIVPVWLLVWAQGTIVQVPKFNKVNWLFLALSAVATGLSWLFSFKALQEADASRVMPIDKFSLVISVGCGVMFLGEAFSWRLVAAVLLIMAGTFLTIQSPKKGGDTTGGSKNAAGAEQPAKGGTAAKASSS